MRQISYSPEAEAALKNIFFYTADKWGIPQARKYHQQFSEAFAIIASNPNVGRNYADISVAYRVFPVNKHFVVYRATTSELFIVAIIHTAMDVDDRLNELLKSEKL